VPARKSPSEARHSRTGTPDPELVTCHHSGDKCLLRKILFRYAWTAGASRCSHTTPDAAPRTHNWQAGIHRKENRSSESKDNVDQREIGVDFRKARQQLRKPTSFRQKEAPTIGTSASRERSGARRRERWHRHVRKWRCLSEIHIDHCAACIDDREARSIINKSACELEKATLTTAKPASSN
jgi:hypothetical protein